MDDLDRALALIGEHADEGDFVGRQPAETVEAAESALGLTFPPTYRRFLQELGAGDIAGDEFYGVVDTSFGGRPPDAVGRTLEARERVGLPDRYVIVGDTGDGDWYVVDTSQGDGPVLIFMPGVPEEDAGPPERVAEDFGAFLAQMVTDSL